jgi:uncharacterized RDD family membrane protein YckC
VIRLAPVEIEPPKSCHQMLGVDRGASADEVTRGFLRAALPYHPAHGADRADPANANRRLRELAGAWSVLTGRAIAGQGGADAQVLRALDDALDDVARRLSRALGTIDQVREALVDEGCPRQVAGLAAERAVDARMATARAALKGGDARPASRPAEIRAASRAAEPGRTATAAAAMSPPVRRDALGRPMLELPVARPDAAGRTGRSADGRGGARTTRSTAAPRADATPRGGLHRIADAWRSLRGEPPPDPEGAIGYGADGDPDGLTWVDATLRQRVAAGGFDAIVLLAAFAAPALLVGLLLGLPVVWLERLAVGASLVGGALLHVVGELGWGGSPGKRLLGLRVETDDGHAPDARTTWLRHGLRTMSCCLFGLGHLFALPRRPARALHDLMTGTRVTTCRPSREDLERSLCVAALVVAVLIVMALRLAA